ncbi:MAG TPA: HEAT repeat domain-containing protein [Chitinispirillaceae bacterium]|nr:HEAT repeat domain-containing protein [Chitinispirillaceae bacterium]
MNLNMAKDSLKSDNPEIVISALHTLTKKGNLAILPDMIALVKSSKNSIKKAATECSCQLIKENLLTHFNELESRIREKLGILLQSLDPAIVDGIGKDLYCNNENRRLRAVQILGLLKKNPRIKDVMAKLVQDKDVKIKATAVNLLGKIIGPNDHELLLSLLNDDDKRVRANTIEALEFLGNKRLVAILLRFRKDLNNRIRGNVLKALYNLGYKEIEPDLIEMLKTNNNFMKASALWVISQTGASTRSLEDAAGECLLSENEMVVNNAKKALKTISTPRAQGYLNYLQNMNPVLTENTQ